MAEPSASTRGKQKLVWEWDWMGAVNLLSNQSYRMEEIKILYWDTGHDYFTRVWSIISLRVKTMGGKFIDKSLHGLSKKHTITTYLY